MHAPCTNCGVDTRNTAHTNDVYSRVYLLAFLRISPHLLACYDTVFEDEQIGRTKLRRRRSVKVCHIFITFMIVSLKSLNFLILFLKVYPHLCTHWSVLFVTVMISSCDEL